VKSLATIQDIKEIIEHLNDTTNMIEQLKQEIAPNSLIVGYANK
jgi:2-polyprenyl-3-methyl-5-hydroxy-6-metoxy-1,4-benzoquinol methylase